MMTTKPASTSTRPRWLLPLLGLTLIAAIAAGAHYNWYLWHPMSGIVVTLVAGGLLLIGGVAFAIRSRRVRPIALVLIVSGIGAIVGQNVGPDRPEIRPRDGGSLRLVETGPTAFDASGKATCNSSADGSQVVVSPDEFGLVRTSEKADFHYLYVTIGDMYDYGDPGKRDDHLSVVITVQGAMIPADADPNARPGETRLTSDAASVLSLGPGHTVDGGSITFANLAIGDPADPARRSDLAGTISWTCGPLATFTPGTDEPLLEEDLSDSPVPG